MKPYGKPKKRSSCKIHSADNYDICSNKNDKVIKARERRKNKIKLQ